MTPVSLEEVTSDLITELLRGLDLPTIPERLLSAQEDGLGVTAVAHFNYGTVRLDESQFVALEAQHARLERLITIKHLHQGVNFGWIVDAPDQPGLTFGIRFRYRDQLD